MALLSLDQIASLNRQCYLLKQRFTAEPHSSLLTGNLTSDLSVLFTHIQDLMQIERICSFSQPPNKELAEHLLRSYDPCMRTVCMSRQPHDLCTPYCRRDLPINVVRPLEYYDKYHSALETNRRSLNSLDFVCMHYYTLERKAYQLQHDYYSLMHPLSGLTPIQKWIELKSLATQRANLTLSFRTAREVQLFSHFAQDEQTHNDIWSAVTTDFRNRLAQVLSPLEALEDRALKQMVQNNQNPFIHDDTTAT